MQITTQEKVEIAKENLKSRDNDGVSFEMNIRELYHLIGEKSFFYFANILNNKNDEIIKLKCKLKKLEEANSHISGRDIANECWDGMAGKELSLKDPEELV